jgi:hypothetical protein
MSSTRDTKSLLNWDGASTLPSGFAETLREMHIPSLYMLRSDTDKQIDLAHNLS